jgi:tRNA/rRNA methyltransferase
MRITFILVEPSVPENIGASARAIKTMGIDSLRLVNPGGFPHAKAWQLAHGSANMLESAGVYARLTEALEDVDFAIGTSAKMKKAHHDYHFPESLPSLLESKKGSIEHLAVVFGREESGLTNDELKLCDIMSGIPMAVKYPSLNLSHAVMIYAYVLSQGRTDMTETKEDKPFGLKHQELKTRIQELLDRLRMGNPTLQGRVMERIALLKDADSNLLFSVLEKLEKRLES